MPDTVSGVNIEFNQEEHELETVESDMEKEIQRMRDRANEMEIALARAPLAIRRLTRIQARKLGIHF